MLCIVSSPPPLGLRTTDDALEAEIKILKSIETVPPKDRNQKSKILLDATSSLPPSSALPLLPLLPTIPGSAEYPVSGVHLGPNALSGPGVSPLHPLKALLFLKLLCVHPCMVTSQTQHKPYYDHLLVGLQGCPTTPTLSLWICCCEINPYSLHFSSLNTHQHLPHFISLNLCPLVPSSCSIPSAHFLLLRFYSPSSTAAVKWLPSLAC